MEEQTARNKREIYTMIVLASIGFLGVTGRLIMNWNGSEDNSQNNSGNNSQDIQIYNNVVEHTTKLPLSCQQTLKLIDCIITSSSGDTASAIILYRQQLSSERNTLAPATLVSTCDSTKKYVMSLPGLEKSCTKSISTEQ